MKWLAELNYIPHSTILCIVHNGLENRFLRSEERVYQISNLSVIQDFKINFLSTLN